MFSDAFSKDHQLIRADPKHSLYLACALMVRGNVQISDLRRNIERFDCVFFKIIYVYCLRQCSRVLRRPLCKFYHCHLTKVWPWASCLASLSLIFLKCKIRIIMEQSCYLRVLNDRRCFIFSKCSETLTIVTGFITTTLLLEVYVLLFDSLFLGKLLYWITIGNCREFYRKIMRPSFLYIPRLLVFFF